MSEKADNRGENYSFGGIALLVAGLYFFLNSVHVQSGQYGVIGRWMSGGRGGYETTSMGVIFVPFLIGVGALFYDVEKRWAWWLSGLGLTLVIVETLSRIQFVMNVKVSTLLLMFVLIAAGAGLLFRGLKMQKERKREQAAKSQAERDVQDEKNARGED